MKFSLKSQILLVMAVTFIISFLVLTSIHYQGMKQGIITGFVKEARDIRGMLMATRRVSLHQFLNSGIPLNDKTIGFLPAHAMAQISKEFGNWSKSGVSFNNVSDIPRNPKQAADALELEAMAWFRANPDALERMVPFTAVDGRAYYHFSTPIYVEKYCLKCHGEEAAAPATIRDNYDTAFDYKVGELRGLVSIKLPADEIDATMWRDLSSMGVAYLLTLLASLVAIYLLIQSRILNNLTGLVGASAKVAQGDFDIHLPATGQGELDRAAAAFNAMADTLKEREAEQRRLQEEALRYLEQMEAVFNNTTSVIYIKDMEGRYLFINRMFETLFHVSNAEVQGKSAHDLFPPEHAEQYCANDLKAVEEDRSVELEERVLQDDGEHTYISVKFPLKAELGDSYAICSISTDITERINAEQRSSWQAALWHSLMASTSEGIFGIDRDGICTFCNPAALNLLGYSDASPLIGKELSQLIHAGNADDSDEPPENFPLRMAIEADQSVRVEDELFWRADGSRVPVVYRVNPISEGDEVIGAVISFEEISELLEAQRVMQERLDELEQFNRLAIGRELQMVELKREINTLLRKQGAEEKYKIEE